MGLSHDQQDAQKVDACLQLVALANTRGCPIVCEDLDFSRKREQLKECGSKYAWLRHAARSDAIKLGLQSFFPAT